MQLKKTIRISISFIACILVVMAGAYTFTQLKSRKESYTVDLFSLIPTDAAFIVGINNPQQFSEQDTSFSFLLPDSNTAGLSALFTNELLLSYHPGGSMLFTKLEKDAYKHLTDNVLKSKFSIFSKQEQYNGVGITIIPAQNEEFFCHSYHKGVFIGSYNKRLIEHAIDLYTRSKNIRTNPTLSAYIDKRSSKATANLFIRKNRVNLPFFKSQSEDWVACQIESEGKDLLLNGIIPSGLENNLYDKIIFQSTGKGGIMNQRMIPQQVQSFIQLNVDSSALLSIVADSLFRSAIEQEIGMCTFLLPDSSGTNSESCEITFFKIKPEQLKHTLSKCSADAQLSAATIKRLFPDKFAADTTLKVAVYNDFLLFGRNNETIAAYINQLPQTETIAPNKLAAGLPDKYQSEAAVVYYYEANDKYLLFLQLQKNYDLLTYSLAIRKSATNF